MGSEQILIGMGPEAEHAEGFSFLAMAHPLASVAAFGRWLADMVHHAFGDPREEALHQPPLVGVQPFRGTTSRRRWG